MRKNSGSPVFPSSSKTEVEDLAVPNAIFSDLKKDLVEHPEISGATSFIRYFEGKGYLYKFHPFTKVVDNMSPDQIDDFTKISREQVKMLQDCGVCTPQTFYFSGGIDHSGSVTKLGISTITSIVEGAKRFSKTEIDNDFLDCYIQTTEGLVEYLKRILNQKGNKYVLYDIFGKMSQYVYTMHPRPQFVLVDLDPRYFDLSQPNVCIHFLIETRRRLLINIDVVIGKCGNNGKRIKELMSLGKDIDVFIDKKLEELYNANPF